jgi:hypothetical protein
MVGFGVVRPLPGIWDAFTINTAITLPIGVEAYAVYALSVATSPRSLPVRTRRYAWVSALAALVLGMGGQITYHLMAAPAQAAGPWQIVALVSCLPVLVLGAASVLWHLAGAATDAGGEVPGNGVGAVGTDADAAAAGAQDSEDPRAAVDVRDPLDEVAGVRVRVVEQTATTTPVPSGLDGQTGHLALDTVETRAPTARNGDSGVHPDLVRVTDPTEVAQGSDPCEAVGDLLVVGRAVAAELARAGEPLNRRTLLAGLRARGRSCSSERAGALLKVLRAA